MKTINKFIVIVMLIVIVYSGVVQAAERVSLGFIYGTKDNVEFVDRTKGAINQVSPTCLDISSKGNLIVTSDLTLEFVNSMKERNILVTPFLSNHWIRSKGRAAIKNTENLTNQIIEVIEEYDLDGINVDIENLTSDDKDGLAEFVRILREKMPEEKLLTVSVAANPEGKETGWQGSYDYEKLGKYANYLFVMTYDENSQGGDCGPVASLEFVEKSVKYALQFVSKDKIVIGIPLYGRFWKEGESNGGEAVVIGAVPNLISKNRGIVKYDEKIGEARVTFSIKNPIIKSKINGEVLEDGKYTIWYQNEESIKAKLNLVNKYDLLGAGVWALGQEKVDVWEYYEKELNKIPYESEKEEKIREEYEALIVDLSNMEEPEIFPLINKINGINVFFEMIVDSEKDEEIYHIESKINKIEYERITLKVDSGQIRVKNHLKYMKKNLGSKMNRVYMDYKNNIK